MVNQQIEEALLDLAAEEAREGGGTLKELRDVTSELEGMIPKGEGRMRLLSSADTLDVWNVHSGRQSKILTDQLRFQLSKKFPANHPLAGQRVYSLKPVEKPAGLKLKCWLHPGHELRPWLDGIGLAEKSCQADSIPTDYAVRVHMRKKHPGAHDMILHQRAEDEKKREKQIQQQQLEALERIAGGNTRKVFECRAEHCGRFFDSEPGRNQHEYTCVHMKEQAERG